MTPDFIPPTPRPTTGLSVGIWPADLPLHELDVAAESASEAKLYATTQPLKGGTAKVLEYEASEEGLRQLSNLIRGERVIAVVLGRKISFETASVVDLTVGNHTITDRRPTQEW